MNPFDLFSVPMTLLILMVALTWIVMHYRSLNQSSRSLTEEDRQSLEAMLVAVDQLVDRIESLESILEADHPNWRQNQDRQASEENEV
jgi:phage shock protein B